MSEKPSLEQIEGVMRDIVIPFYGIQRDMNIPDSTRRLETDAEHSWSLAFTACALAPQIDPDLDVGLIAQMAIVHDVPEIYASDVSVWDSPQKLAKKHDEELKARQRIAQDYGHLPWISETIEIYERRDTKEAKFVYALDKLLALLTRKIDNGQAYIDMKISKEKFLEGLAGSRQKAQSHPEIGTYFEELWAVFESHPEFFYQPK